MRFVILGSIVLLTACNTTNEKQHDLATVKADNPYSLGYYVKYSELCANFSGSGADNRSMAMLKRKFKNDTQFAKGYAVNQGLEGSDVVTGLDDCKLAKAVVENEAN